MRKKITDLWKPVLTLTAFPLMFIKWFHEVSLQPNEEGEFIRTDFYFSMADNLREYFPFAIACAVLAVLSLTVWLTYFKRSNPKTRKIGNIAFGVFLFAFAVFFCLSAAVNRKY